jgi:hypothetical protein
LAVFIFESIRADLAKLKHVKAKLHEVKIWETDKNIMVYRGE